MHFEGCLLLLNCNFHAAILLRSINFEKITIKIDSFESCITTSGKKKYIRSCDDDNFVVFWSHGIERSELIFMVGCKLVENDKRKVRKKE